MRKKGVLKVNAMVFLWNAPSLSLFETLGYNKQSNMVVMGKALDGNRRSPRLSARTRGDGVRQRGARESR